MRDDSDAVGEPRARDAARPPPDREGPTTHPADALRFVCVKYTDEPDRCTIHPWDASRLQVTTTWLTADRSAFVDLAEVR